MNEDKQNNSKIKQISDVLNKKIHRDVLKWIVIGFAAFAIVGLIFGLGMFVGGAKARFSYRWAESYHKNFAGPSAGFLGDWRSFSGGNFIEGHGAFGEIIELRDTGFVIKGRGDVEKIVVTTKDTVVMKGRETVKNELKVGDSVVIIGSPNEEGQIEAKLIRIFDGELRKAPMPLKPSRFPFF
jgi:hypothetical protein